MKFEIDSYEGITEKELLKLRANLRLKRGRVRRSGQPNQSDIVMIATLSALIRNITNKIENNEKISQLRAFQI